MNDEAIFEAKMISKTAGADFTWNFGDGGIATGAIVKHKFTKPGNYKVSLKIVNKLKSGCCSSIVEKTVIVKKVE